METMLFPGCFLLPSRAEDFLSWACIACDQHITNPDYWAHVALQTQGKPSTYHLMLPETELASAKQIIPRLHQTMKEYLAKGIVKPAVSNGYLLVERNTSAGARLGLVCLVDLEAYSYTEPCAVRPTEKTITERIPPRMTIRQNAPMELSHVLLLMDDPMQTVLEPLFDQRQNLRKCYDFPLMMQGGHITGYAIEDPAHVQSIQNALAALPSMADGMRFAVGDGNHSLATAKACWEKIKQTLSLEQQKNHPARYAMVELVNLQDDAMQILPIHRLLCGYDGDELLQDMALYASEKGIDLASTNAQEMRIVYEGKEVCCFLGKAQDEWAVSSLDLFFAWLKKRRPSVTWEYVHGEMALRQEAQKKETVGFRMPEIDKSAFLPLVSRLGTLPAKTFSLGEADDKRFYVECRAL